MSGFSTYHLITIKPFGFPASLPKLFSRDAYICDVQFRLCEVGTGEDEAEVSVGGYYPFGVTFGEEAFFASLDVIPEAASKTTR